ncbi:hypothetical protein M5D96_010424 [Drosophila gunungcola]|uniref:Uncharacterized protein n=1 Tax=Drosophila gunungcola TaxID=103775 RepID=A0A9P9YHC0_9MUSC|nr:hypothetical protein M5D96_010424 [Drosophila gunungcola]
MFCAESCEHGCNGCNATSSGNVIAPGNGSAQAQSVTVTPQQQFNMCYAPLSMQFDQRFGQQVRGGATAGGNVPGHRMPGGSESKKRFRPIIIDCNVPLPSSFNLDEYNKPMICSCCSQCNGGCLDTYRSAQAVTTCPNPITNSNPNPIQTPPASSFQCQCSPFAGACPGHDAQSAPKAQVCPLPKPPGTNRPEQGMAMAQTISAPAAMPQIFCLTGPTSEGSIHQPDQQPVYFCSLMPVVVPMAPSQQPPQQQLMTSPAQDSQLPPQQLVRYDLPYSQSRSCCEFQLQTPLSFQLFAPMVRFCEPPNPSPVKGAHLPGSLATPSPPVATSSSSVRLPRARSVSPKRSRSCLRSKDLWASGGPTVSAAPSHAPYPSPAQHGAGNVCMKCGNCWHCPRCNCSNCFWHPGLGRAPPRDTR